VGRAMRGPARRGRLAGSGWLVIVGVLVVSAMVPAVALAGAGSPDRASGQAGSSNTSSGSVPTHRSRGCERSLWRPVGSSISRASREMGEGDFEVLAGRLDEDGSLDPSFGSGGSVRSFPVENPNLRDEYAESEAVQSDGGSPDRLGADRLHLRLRFAEKLAEVCRELRGLILGDQCVGVGYLHEAPLG